MTDPAAGGPIPAGQGICQAQCPGRRANRACCSHLLSREPHLVVLIGVAGSGKSALARSLWQDSGQVVSLDALRAVVSGDESDQSATADAAELMHRIVAARLRRQLTTVVDATNVQERARSPLLAAARLHDVCAIALIVNTPLPVCLDRNAGRPGPVPGIRWARQVPEHAIRRQFADLTRSLPGLAGEGFTHVLVYDGGPARAVGPPRMQRCRPAEAART